MRWRMLGWICLAELGALSLWFSATAVVPALRTAWMSTGAQAWLSMAVTLGFVVGTIASAVLTLTDFVGARRLFVLTADRRRPGQPGPAGRHRVPAPRPRLPVPHRPRDGGHVPAGHEARRELVRDGPRPGRRQPGGRAHPGRGRPAPDQRRGRAGVAAGHRRDVARGARAPPSSWRRSSATAPTSRPGPPSTLRCIRELVRSRGVVLASLGYFGHMWELYAMWTWIGLYLLEAFTRAGPAGGAAPRRDRHRDRDRRRARRAASWRASSADRIGRTAVTMLAMVGSGTCAAVIGFTFDRPGWLVLVALVWGFTIVADSAQFSAAITELAPAGLRGDGAVTPDEPGVPAHAGLDLARAAGGRGLGLAVGLRVPGPRPRPGHARDGARSAGFPRAPQARRRPPLKSPTALAVLVLVS